MKTKAFFTSFFLLLFTCTAAFAVVKENRNVGSFTKVSIGSAFKVYLSIGSTQSVEVEIDDEYINDVQTSVSGGTLYVKLTDGGRGNRNIRVMNVYITMPALDGIVASGAAKFNIETPIKSSGTVSFDLSGASAVKDVELSCAKLDIEQSGASKCSIKLTAKEVNIDISGAANLNLSGKVDDLNVEGSGAAKVDVRNLKYSKSDVDMSAAASLKK
ncbi:MAG: DUF2807 domain-containing protein [Prevotellaceae bacterium]|jgi:hypothetical protein|nr:DUF2807 domain-containing protein [Prevotellaceae bacterium]